MSHAHIDAGLSLELPLKERLGALFSRVMDMLSLRERRDCNCAVSRYLCSGGACYRHLPRRALARNAHWLAARDDEGLAGDRLD